ncbi:hypothetical protein CDV31_007511 [Fusarium ambrosium]|uniref:CNO-like protein 1 n=1 Tax=Fusarium ambrosium TaxID=131363 RepID=A0A428U639_9HYPO|nr:hypothetical protein CDV31_007511 [Fusarium ambrosium]
MSNTNQFNLDNLNSEERRILAQMRTQAQREVSRPSTPEIGDVDMSTPVPSPQMTTSTHIANTTFDEGVAHINKRLQQIDSKHTKALESHAEAQAENFREVDQLILVCSSEIKRIEGDNETVNDIVTRFEEGMGKRLDKVERQLEKLTKL